MNFQGALGRALYTLHLSHISPPLGRSLSFFIIMIIMERSSLSIFDDKTCSFSLSLPSPWGVPLAWSLSALPLLPLLVGLLVHLVLAGEVRLLFLYSHSRRTPPRPPLSVSLCALLLQAIHPITSHPILSWVMRPLIIFQGGKGRGKHLRTSFIPSARW